MTKVAIVTSFAEFNPGYSLTGIVEDQIAMLSAHGHEVHLFVREQFNRDTANERIMLAQLHDTIPHIDLVDYRSEKDLLEVHRGAARRTGEVLAAELKGVNLAFTHDLLFTGWNLPYALGVRQASPKLPDLFWLHWLHSIPSARRDWWNLHSYGPNHRLVYPNQSDAMRAAENYRCHLGDIEVIPHIKDMRTWADFHPDTCKFIDRHPAVMQADIVQILPAGQDRLKYKRVPEVIKLFGAFKQRGKSVCLVAANQWAAQTTYKRNMEEYKALAIASGLVPGREFIFTSDFDFPRFETGIPKRMVRELMSLANLFIFPTHHESFGLVVPEAGLSGALLVLNRSLNMQLEISNGQALFFEFGSYERQISHRDDDAWLDAVAGVILRAMNKNLPLSTKTFMRQKYNRDALYRDYYQPVLDECNLKQMEKAA